jgi:hypothetical protein
MRGVSWKGLRALLSRPSDGNGSRIHLKPITGMKAKWMEFLFPLFPIALGAAILLLWLLLQIVRVFLGR